MSDDYEEEQIAEEVAPANERSDAEYQSEVSAREKEVTKLLNTGAPLKALPIALDNPPTHTKSQEIKDQNTTIVLNVLAALKEKDFDEVVKSLNEDQQDILMKAIQMTQPRYIYKGLASGDQSGPLLKLHELLLKKAGLGSIVRALTERKTV